MKQLTIIRAQWFRGKGTTMQSLLLYNEMMCCLGFLGSSCGLKKEELVNHATPQCTLFGLTYDAKQSIYNLWPPKLFEHERHNSNWTIIAMEINDDELISDAIRETKLTEHFKLIDYELTFV